jgi:putative transport protein
MNWWSDLWFGTSTAHQVLLISVASAVGIAIGKIKVFGLSIGIVGVLFVALFLGHLGFQIDAHVLEFARDFGFVLFAYTLGLQIGPGFAGALKQRGLLFNSIAFLVVGLGVALVSGWIVWKHVPVPSGVGVFSGATTSTPSFAAAQQALKQLGAPEESLVRQSLGYAVTYPCGIIGLILTFVFIKFAFRVDVNAEVAALAQRQHASLGPRPEARNFEVRNPNLDGCLLSKIPGISGVVVSRISRDGHAEIARQEARVKIGDLLHAVGIPKKLEELRIVVGAESPVDVKTLPGMVSNRRLIVTHVRILGHTLEELTLLANEPVVVSRVTRGGIEFTPTPDMRVQFGDILMVVGENKALDEIAAAVGNSTKALDTPQLIPLFLGLALGMIAGAVPLAVPNLPAAVKMGLAGGPLIVGIILGRYGNTGRLVWHLPPSASLILRDFGIAIFLAGIGLKSGEHFAEVMFGENGFTWILWGMVFTTVPLLLVGCIARLWKKVNYAELCGLLAGSLTDSPALAFAQQMTGSDAPALAYATVYPLTMLLRVVSAQLLVFMLS